MEVEQIHTHAHTHSFEAGLGKCTKKNDLVAGTTQGHFETSPLPMECVCARQRT